MESALEVGEAPCQEEGCLLLLVLYWIFGYLDRHLRWQGATGIEMKTWRGLRSGEGGSWEAGELCLYRASAPALI